MAAISPSLEIFKEALRPYVKRVAPRNLNDLAYSTLFLLQHSAFGLIYIFPFVADLLPLAFCFILEERYPCRKPPLFGGLPKFVALFDCDSAFCVCLTALSRYVLPFSRLLRPGSHSSAAAKNSSTRQQHPSLGFHNKATPPQSSPLS